MNMLLRVTQRGLFLVLKTSKTNSQHCNRKLSWGCLYSGVFLFQIFALISFESFKYRNPLNPIFPNDINTLSIWVYNYLLEKKEKQHFGPTIIFLQSHKIQSWRLENYRTFSLYNCACVCFSVIVRYKRTYRKKAEVFPDIILWSTQCACVQVCLHFAQEQQHLMLAGHLIY